MAAAKPEVLIYTDHIATLFHRLSILGVQEVHGAISNTARCDFWPRNMETSRCNGAAILSRSWDKSTTGLAAAILKTRLPVTSGSIRNRTNELLDLENNG